MIRDARMKTLFAVISLSGCAVSSVDSSTSSALTAADTVHTGAGALVTRRADGSLRQLCSGALVAPTVFVTAGHCTDAANASGQPIFVTFDQKVIASSAVVAGTAITSPDFNPSAYNINSDMHDVGVVLLAEAQSRPVYALPRQGLFAPGAVQPGAKITAVGYGVDQIGESGNPGESYVNDKTRDYGTLKFRAATSWLLADQVFADGACFGDSGGPDFMTFNGQEHLVAINSVVNGYDCNEVAWLYRLDGDATRAFLAQYTSLP